MLSNLLLDVHRYDDSSNDYNDSEIRSWLNNEFYNSAFALSNNAIKKTSKTNYDNVSLLTKDDYLNSSYGFSTSYDESETRLCNTTDWARVNYAYCPLSDEHIYNGNYFTRSSDSDNIHYVWFVNPIGILSRQAPVDSHLVCARPCISIVI